MRTIDNILEYNISDEETEALLSCGIINGCGGEGSFSFDNFLRDNLEHLECFDKEKRIELLHDLKRICYEHDIDYRFKKGFYKSNYIMANKLFKLLHWTPLKARLAISIILFILLNRYGKEFYYAK